MFLERRDRENNGYSLLQKQTLELLQQLSGKVWTDFNVHDPGVTIAETFNYALYELDYQFQFPFESFLNNGEPCSDLSSLGLFPAEKVLGDTIATLSDYELLIENRIQEVTHCRFCLTPEKRYRIEVVLSGGDPGIIREQVKQLYHAHRNLGETLQEVVVTDSLPLPHRKTISSPKPTPSWENTPAPALPESYYSLQHHFPECYGLGDRGLSGNASPGYQAEVRQLKAYLLIYDYLLANTGKQLKEIRNLLTLEEPEEVFREMPKVTIREIEKLIDPTRFNHSPEHSNHFRSLQKSRILDVLDTLYGEDSRRFFPASPLPRQNQERARLIPSLPELNRNRFRAVNLLDSQPQLIPARQWIGWVSGCRTEAEEPLSHFFAGYRLRLLDDREFFTKHRQKLSINLLDNPPADRLEKIRPGNIYYEESQYKELHRRINLLWHNLLYQSFLVYGANLSNYRMVDLREKGYLLVFRIPKNKGWLHLGQFYEKEVLIRIVHQFCGFIRHLSQQSQRFYLLEHILLESPGETKESSHRLSLVFPRWNKSLQKKRTRKKIRERLPAHLRVEFKTLPARQMEELEKAYYQWRSAWVEANEEKIRQQAEILKSLLTPQTSRK